MYNVNCYDIMYNVNYHDNMYMTDDEAVVQYFMLMNKH